MQQPASDTTHNTPASAEPVCAAVLCDIDGCLMPEDGGPANAAALAVLAQRNRRAIEIHEGPVVTLCSGRPIAFVEAMCRVVGNTVMPAIGEMGAWIYDPVTQLMHLDPSIEQAHLNAINALSRWVDEHYHTRPLFQQPGKTASISLYHADTAYLMEQFEALTDKIAAESWPIRVSRTWCWINCDLAHISKSTGIDRWCAMTDLDRSQLAGIGDTMGDIAIRERVAWFGCPFNAADDLKARADAVSEEDEAMGVLDLLGMLEERFHEHTVSSPA